MLEIASQMILCLLLAALIGAIIGYLLGKSTCADDDCGQDDTEAYVDDNYSVHNAHKIDSTTAVAGVAATTISTSGATDLGNIVKKPLLLTAARNGKPDKLTHIKGVGDKVEEELNNSGIYHYDQIASWDDKNIAWADDTLGFPGRAERERWVPQAKILASGETTEFSKSFNASDIDSNVANKPSLLSGPRNGQSDNLTLIKGVGAKIEAELNNVGIYHFDQIASWNPDNIQWADDTLGFPGRAEREEWVKQATTLASGEATEFSKRVDAGEVTSSKKS